MFLILISRTATNKIQCIVNNSDFNWDIKINVYVLKKSGD